MRYKKIYALLFLIKCVHATNDLENLAISLQELHAKAPVSSIDVHQQGQRPPTIEYTPENINNYDEKGFRPLYYAIVENRLNDIKKYIGMGAYIEYIEDLKVGTTGWMRRIIESSNADAIKLALSNPEYLQSLKALISIPRVQEKLKNPQFLEDAVTFNNTQGAELILPYVQPTSEKVYELIRDILQKNLNISLISMLLAKIPDIETSINQSETIKDIFKFVGIHNLNNDVIKILTEHGATNQDLLEYAAKSSENLELLKKLLGNPETKEFINKGDPTPLSLAIQNNNIHAIRLLIEHGALISPKDMTLVIRDKGIRELLDNEWKLQNLIKRNNNDIVEAFFAAAQDRFSPDVLEVFLQRSPELISKEIRGETALNYAIRAKNPNAVQILMKHGASPVSKHDFVNNALNEAAVWKDGNQSLKVLLTFKTVQDQINTKNNPDKRTPLVTAINSNNQEAQEILRSYGAKG